MLSIQITDIKNFMAHLLSKDSFDRFYLVEASIKMGISYHLDGHLNHDFYDTDVSQNLNRAYCFWKEARPYIFHIIKGKRLPLGCKIILALPASSLLFLLKESNSSFRPEDIEGVYINILYESKNLLLTTGVSYRTFSLDKSLEHCVDEHIQKFIKEKGLC